MCVGFRLGGVIKLTGWFRGNAVVVFGGVEGDMRVQRCRRCVFRIVVVMSRC